MKLNKPFLKRGDIIFNENLIKARKKAGMTQVQVAESLWITQQTLQKWERGKGSEPSVARLVQMAELYQVSLDELIKGEHNDNR